MNQADHFHLLEAHKLDAIFMTIGGVFVCANPRASQLLLGDCSDSLIGKTLADFCPADQPDPVCPSTSDPSARLQQTLRRLDGQNIWVELRCLPFQFENQDAVLFFMRELDSGESSSQTIATPTAQQPERPQAAQTRILCEQILHTAPYAILVFRQDGQCILANPAAAGMIGGTRQQLEAQNFRNLVAWQHSGLLETADRVLASGSAERIEWRLGTSFGRQLSAEIQLSRFTLDGHPHLLLMMQEIDRKANLPLDSSGDRLACDLLAERRNAERERRLTASLLRTSSEGVLITDAAGKILEVNSAFCDITGYSRQEAIGNKPSMLRSEHHSPEFYQQLWRALKSRGYWQGEIWNRRRNGQAYLEWLSINRIDDEQGRPVRYVGMFQDLTEARRKDEHIRHLAFHDALTGLPNRELLLERLRQALARARREGQRLSVTFIDLDRFKGVNDALGHDVGDSLLQQVGQRLRARLRHTDTVARVGGDEFLVLMENLSSPRQCAAKARQLLDEIARPVILPDYELEITASMGSAFYPEDSDQPLELMKRADTAMYAAKSAGGNTYHFFREEMLKRSEHRLTLEMDLRRALAREELELHYQPKIDLNSGQLIGVEALLRWQHPQRGLQSPAEFIPLAEESNLICDIGHWVLHEACLQGAHWLAQGQQIPIAVNISARQLESGNLLELIPGLMEQIRLPAHLLELELTESTLMADPRAVAGLLAQLRDAGVRVAVDDFGTGYSSLAYLRRLPLDSLKIDRSFVQDAIHNEEDAQIIRTILALGKSLKMEVIAEGIENEHQASLLRRLGCERAQGYLFGRPMPPDQFSRWLTLTSPVD